MNNYYRSITLILGILLIGYLINDHPKPMEEFETSVEFRDQKWSLYQAKTVEQVGTEHSKCQNWCSTVENTQDTDLCEFRCDEFKQEMEDVISYQRLQFG